MVLATERQVWRSLAVRRALPVEACADFPAGAPTAGPRRRATLPHLQHLVLSRCLQPFAKGIQVQSDSPSILLVCHVHFKKLAESHSVVVVYFPSAEKERYIPKPGSLQQRLPGGRMRLQLRKISPAKLLPLLLIVFRSGVLGAPAAANLLIARLPCGCRAATTVRPGIACHHQIQSVRTLA